MCVSQEETPKGRIYPLTSSQLETTQQVRGFIDVQMQQMKWLVWESLASELEKQHIRWQERKVISSAFSSRTEEEKLDMLPITLPLIFIKLTTPQLFTFIFVGLFFSAFHKGAIAQFKKKENKHVVSIIPKNRHGCHKKNIQQYCLFDLQYKK